jgi:hypothetical protein
VKVKEEIVNRYGEGRNSRTDLVKENMVEGKGRSSKQTW